MAKNTNRKKAMNINLWQWIIKFWQASFFSPQGFVQRALVIGLGFLTVHLAGLREYTSVLNGTIGSVSAGWETSAFLGVVYIIVYLAFVILAPVLVLAAIILAVLRRANSKSAS
ncbi:MAG: hypothetical protein ACREOZ_03410 [Gloeomargaritales cyanobacterium]